jgi:hypothetical protein
MILMPLEAFLIFNMGNVPSTHIFIENLCGAGYEMGFPKGADLLKSYQRV